MAREVKHSVEYVALEKLKKHPNNPRTISKDDFEKLKTSINDNPDYFEARPLIVSSRTGENIILAGNQRYEAAKSLGLDSAPAVIFPDLTEEREKEIIIRDNISNGDWDFELLANNFDAGDLLDWGLEIDDMADIVELASEGAVHDFAEETDYDPTKFYREKISENIFEEIKDGVENGMIREELANVFYDRAKQYTIFNFDQLAKYYRSEDCSEVEKNL